MLLTYAIVAANIAGSTAVILLTWACLRGAKAERGIKNASQPSAPACK